MLALFAHWHGGRLIMFDLSFLKKSVDDLAGRVRGLRSDIENLKRERESVQTAPAARADVKAIAHAWVKDRADTYAKQLARSWTRAINQPEKLLNDDRMPEMLSLCGAIVFHSPTGVPAGGAGVDSALCALFGTELMTEALGKVIDKMPWPGPEGLPLVQRKKRLSELDAEIAKREDELEKMLRAAAAAGVVIQ